jgi:hypothetical protein
MTSGMSFSREEVEQLMVLARMFPQRNVSEIIDESVAEKE